MKTLVISACLRMFNVKGVFEFDFNKFNLNKNTCLCLPHRQNSSRIHQIIEFKVTKSSLCGGNKKIDNFIAPASTSSPLHKICLKKQMFKSVGNDYIYQSDSSSSEVIFFKIRHFIISTFHPFFVGQKVCLYATESLQKLKRTFNNS